MFKLNNKNTRTTSRRVFGISEHISHLFSSVSIADIEQVLFVIIMSRTSFESR